MDLTLIKEIGVPAVSYLSVIGLVIWIVKKVFTMQEKSTDRAHDMATKKEEAFLVLIKNAADERRNTLAVQEKHMEKIDRGLAYMKQEHELQMKHAEKHTEILNELKDQVRLGICKANKKGEIS